MVEAGTPSDVGLDPVICLGTPRLAAASYSPGGSICGKARIEPFLYEASKCIAMINSVSPKCPCCSLSARFHIRPSTSLGSCARSKICFALSPARIESAIGRMKQLRRIQYQIDVHSEPLTPQIEKSIAGPCRVSVVAPGLDHRYSGLVKAAVAERALEVV